MNRNKMIVIMGLVFITSVTTLLLIGRQEFNEKTLADIAFEESVSDELILELLKKHDNITIAIATKEGYDPREDITALIEELDKYNTNRTELIKNSLEEILKGNKDKSEGFYFKALFDN